jgi:hypothetical protein
MADSGTITAAATSLTESFLVLGKQSTGDTTTPDSIMAAARVRWPQWGPWKVTVAHFEDGRMECSLFGKSPVPSKFENRVRIGKDLAELGRRVMEPDGGNPGPS